jgi:hypothetical protein
MATDLAWYPLSFDPNHSTGPTTDKLFGKAGLAAGATTPTMDGFLEFESSRHKESLEVLNMFTPDRLPIMTTLVQPKHAFLAAKQPPY